MAGKCAAARSVTAAGAALTQAATGSCHTPPFILPFAPQLVEPAQGRTVPERRVHGSARCQQLIGDAEASPPAQCAIVCTEEDGRGV